MFDESTFNFREDVISWQIFGFYVDLISRTINFCKFCADLMVTKHKITQRVPHNFFLNFAASFNYLERRTWKIANIIVTYFLLSNFILRCSFWSSARVKFRGWQILGYFARIIIRGKGQNLRNIKTRKAVETYPH